MTGRLGFDLVQHRSGGPTQLLEKTVQFAGNVDVKCRATGSLTGSLTGSDPVVIDWANYVDGQTPPVKAAAAADQPIAGVVHWGEGSKASGDLVLVRVRGKHPYAKIDGSGTAVAAGDRLAINASNKLVKTTTNGNRTARALAAVSTDSYGAVYLHDDERLSHV